MICGGCKHPFSLIEFLRIHWLQTGCSWGREIWARVTRAHRNGTSGRRILSSAFPAIYKSKPMPEEVKAFWRARKAGGN